MLSLKNGVTLWLIASLGSIHGADRVEKEAKGTDNSVCVMLSNNLENRLSKLEWSPCKVKFPLFALNFVGLCNGRAKNARGFFDLYKHFIKNLWPSLSSLPLKELDQEEWFLRAACIKLSYPLNASVPALGLSERDWLQSIVNGAHASLQDYSFQTYRAEHTAPNLPARVRHLYPFLEALYSFQDLLRLLYTEVVCGFDNQLEIVQASAGKVRLFVPDQPKRVLQRLKYLRNIARISDQDFYALETEIAAQNPMVLEDMINKLNALQIFPESLCSRPFTLLLQYISAYRAYENLVGYPRAVLKSQHEAIKNLKIKDKAARQIVEQLPAFASTSSVL